MQKIPRVKSRKGNPGKKFKIGGKAAGTLETKIVERIEDLKAILKAEGCDDPFTALARIARKAEKGKKWELAASIHKELAQYLMPKRRSIELPPDIGPITIRWAGSAQPAPQLTAGTTAGPLQQPLPTTI